MKNYSNLIKCKFAIAFYAICMLFAAVSCSDPMEGVDDEEQTISSNSSSLDFGAADNLSQTITITSTDEWSLLDGSIQSKYEYADWVTSVTPASADGDSEVVITVDDNRSIEERQTILYFGIPKESGDYELLKINVKQQAGNFPLNVVSPGWFMSESDNDADLTRTATITTNSNWRVLTAEDGEKYAFDEWISLSATSGEGNGTIDVTAQSSEQCLEYTRTTVFYVATDIEGVDTVGVSVSQFGYNSHHISSPNFPNDTIRVKQNGTIDEAFSPFVIVTSHPWIFHSVEGNDEDGYPAWVTPSPLSGIANDEVSLVCEPNTDISKREALLNIGLVTKTTGTHYYKKFRIVQDGFQDASFSLSTDDIVIPANGSAQNIKVTSSADWKICFDSPYLNDEVKWLTVSKENEELGESGEVIAFSAEKNTSLDSRQTKIYFTMEDTYPDMKPLVYTITQEGVNPDAVDNVVLSPKTLDFLYNSSSSMSQTVQVTSDLDWELDPQVEFAAWAKITPTSGKAGTTQVQISVNPNDFLTARATTISFIQPSKQNPVATNLSISQELNESSWLYDYGALGCGYNTAGEYGSQKEVRNAVLDCDKLYANGLIDRITDYSNTDGKVVKYNSMTDARDALNTGANISGGYNGFSASVAANYGTTNMEFEETEYASYKRVFGKATIQVKGTNDEGAFITNLKSCLTDEARAAINSGNIADLLANYGTHVVLGYVKGGVHEYTVSVIRTSAQKTQDFGVQVQAGYESLAGSAVAGTEITGSSELKKESFSCEETLRVRGGVGSSSADDWVNSLKADNIQLVDFAGNGLFPIWKLADDSSRQIAIEEEAKRNAQENQIGEASRKGVFKYDFWIGNVAYLATDNGGHTAEMKLLWQSKNCDAGESQYSAAQWAEKWRMWDNEEMNITCYEDWYDNFLPKGTDYNEGDTNRVTTKEMFLGGAKQYEISFKIELAEDDVTNHTQHYTTYYQYFRTKDFYDRTKGGDPFWYNSSSAEVDRPQFGTGVSQNTWWSNTPQSRGYNGCVQVNLKDVSTDTPWGWQIYYCEAN